MDVTNTNFYLKQSLVNSRFDIDDAHITAVEKIFRNSLEYTSVIADRRLNEGDNFCPLLSDYDFSKKKCTLQLHHCITLYEIVRCAYEKLIEENKKNISTFDVAELVCYWHYEGAFLFVFLSKSAHELVHSGQYTVDKKNIKGNPSLIKKEYYEFLKPIDKDLVDALIGDTNEQV